MLQEYLLLLDQLTTNPSAGIQKIEALEECQQFLSNFPDSPAKISPLFLILQIQKECQNQWDTVSINHQNSIANIFERTALATLENLLPHNFHFLAVRKKDIVNTNFQPNVDLLCSIIDIIADLFEIKLLALNALLESVAIQYVVAIFYCLHAKPRPERMETCERHLKQIPRLFGTFNAFRFLIIVKGMHHLPVDIGRLVHKRLIHQLRQPGGFAIFCRILLAHDENPDDPNWERYQSIAKVVGAKGYTKAFYLHMVQDIVKFMRHSLASEQDRKFSQPCVVCLKQIYSLDNVEVSRAVETQIFEDLEKLVQPPDVLSGAIVAEEVQIIGTLQLLCVTFNGSIDKSTFPSLLLVPYLPLLFQMLVLLDDHEIICNRIRFLILLCLQNRSDNELSNVIGQMLLPAGNHRIHPRIEVVRTGTEVRLQIASESRDDHNLAASTVLVEMLKSSANNPLMYKVFVSLLKILEDGSANSPTAAGVNDLLCGEDDEALIAERINKMFYQRTILVASLCQLLAHKPFHVQFKEHPDDLIAFGHRILVRKVEQLRRGCRDADDEDESTEIVLTIFGELSSLLQKTAPETVKVLRDYQRLCRSERISELIKRLLNDDTAPSCRKVSTFDEALALCADKSAPIKVEGIDKMIKLIEIGDGEAKSFRHKILILTLDNLRDAESYVYLNSVLLLISLTKLMEEEVIDALITEFTNTNSDTDLRLKVGEALVKVLEAMGPLTYKYKDLLINTFLRICQSQEPVEFRTSCTSNLATVARILSYQVHTYFYELLTFVESVVSCEQYVPLRRAAVLTLAQLLAGMDKLTDLSDYVLQVYRFLKQIVQTDTDETTSLHAAIGLETLKAKTKDFLQPELELQKKIRVLGIAEETSSLEISYK